MRSSLIALKTLRLALQKSYTETKTSNFHSFPRFLSAQPTQKEEEEEEALGDHRHHSQSDGVLNGLDDSVFDSRWYSVSNPQVNGFESGVKTATWDEKYRDRADKVVFGRERTKPQKVKFRKVEEEEEDDRRRKELLARALLEAALEDADEEEEGEVREEDQKSLTVGIIGAPNAGKSALTNYMVGTKVSAVSRKTNTTSHEILGVITKGDTQMCFFDTPGLLLNKQGFPYKDVKARVESAWSTIKLFDVLMVIVDVHRHITRPDSRVLNLIKRVGALAKTKQKRVLCMNKIDLVENKKDLLKVTEQFKDLPGYDRHLMISGLKGAGVKDLMQYLMEQAVKRPWDEDPTTISEEVMKNISLEVVRERLLDHVHQEVPYDIEHRLVDWKELRDGSLRIEQHFITHKPSRRMILVGKKGSKIGRIGVEANEELRSIFKREVHLILQVRLK